MRSSNTELGFWCATLAHQNLLYHPVFGKTLQIWAFLIASSFLRMLAGGAQARKGLQ